MKESDLIKNIQVAVASHNVRLHRNNIGQYTTSSGVVIRYGVVNPGGSDLIGWTQREVTIDDVGKTFAIFTAVEVKTGRLKPTAQQLNFIDPVTKAIWLLSLRSAAPSTEHPTHEYKFAVRLMETVP